MSKFRSKSSGFTLIEMMIVVSVIGFVAVLGANIMSGSFRSKARELQWRMASTIRYLYNSAVTESKTMRLVLDIKGGTYWAEATTDKFLLERASDKKDKPKPEPDDNEPSPSATERAEANMPDEAKQAMGLADEEKKSDTVNDVIEPAEAVFGTVDSPILEVVKLPNGISIKDVYTEHDGDQPVTEDKAYIYFFTNGYAEPSVINFKNEDDTKQFSIKLSPYSGDIDIVPEYRTLGATKK